MSTDQEVIKVRKPRVISCFGIAGIYERYSNRQYKFTQTLPNNGDKIRITWFPKNRGVVNAYIGWEGVVEEMDKVDATFWINSGNAKLLCHGNFDYIKLD